MQAKQNCEMSSPSISTLLAASGNRVVYGHAQQREHQQNGTHGQRTGGIPLKESSQLPLIPSSKDSTEMRLTGSRTADCSVDEVTKQEHECWIAPPTPPFLKDENPADINPAAIDNEITEYYRGAFFPSSTKLKSCTDTDSSSKPLFLSAATNSPAIALPPLTPPTRHSSSHVHCVLGTRSTVKKHHPFYASSIAAKGGGGSNENDSFQYSAHSARTPIPADFAMTAGPTPMTDAILTESLLSLAAASPFHRSSSVVHSTLPYSSPTAAAGPTLSSPSYSAFTAALMTNSQGQRKTPVFFVPADTASMTPRLLKPSLSYLQQQREHRSSTASHRSSQQKHSVSFHQASSVHRSSTTELAATNGFTFRAQLSSDDAPASIDNKVMKPWSTPAATIPSNPKPKYLRWSQREDDTLRRAIFETSNGQPPFRWKSIALHYFSNKSRTESQCRSRWIRTLNPKLKLGHWSKAEDALIRKLRHDDGLEFADIAHQLPGRRMDSIRDRYQAILDPMLRKERWTAEEKIALFDAVQMVGPKWKAIAPQFPGRSEASCKNTWFNALQSKKRKERAEKKSKIVEAKVCSAKKRVGIGESIAEGTTTTQCGASSLKRTLDVQLLEMVTHGTKKVGGNRSKTTNVGVVRVRGRMSESQCTGTPKEKMLRATGVKEQKAQTRLI